MLKRNNKVKALQLSGPLGMEHRSRKEILVCSCSFVCREEKNRIRFGLSPHLLNLEVFICSLLSSKGIFGDGETNCECSCRKREEERWIKGLRERKRGKLCVWAMEGKDKRLFFDGVRRRLK